MAMQIIRFAPDGWSARVGEDFTPENVVRVADALGKLWGTEHPGGRVYVGYDTRAGADAFARLAGEVIASYGLDVVLSETFCPTPALGWTVANDKRACGGVMITASQESASYLGIRVRMPDGGTCPEEELRVIEALVEPVPSSQRGVVSLADVVTPYKESLEALLDADAIRSAGLTVVHDPMYGAAREVFAGILRDLDVNVIAIHDGESEGFGGLHPDPVEPWVDECEQAVVENHAVAALIQDGDGDRLGAVDEEGRFVAVQTLVPLILDHLVENRGLTGRVVLNVSGSTLTRREARRLGCRLTITPIGFARLHGEMLRGDVLLGSDGEGGIAVPSHLAERDGILASLLVVEAMAMRGKTLGQLVAELEDKAGHMDYGRRDIRLDAATVQSLRNMLPGMNPPAVAGMEPVSVSHADGLRLQFADESWVLVRPSRAESLVRIYAEAPTVEERDALIEGGCALARGDA
jgi:phosphomannomutase